MSLKNGMKMEIKEEVDNSDEGMDEEDAPVFSPAAMGLKRVGEEMPPRPSPQPGLALNRRGMPARIRKKNRLFFDDDDVPPSTPSPRASPSKRATAPKPSPAKPRHAPQKSAASPAKRFKLPAVVIEDDVAVKEEPEDLMDESPLSGGSPDRKSGQRTGMRLRNMLKLPKAHKWVCYEWFYSNIDRPLYFGSNDFLLCLHESFPTLSARRLRRVEWCLLRRMMGKPRRCSQAFFLEERNELDRKRAKIRLIQQRKIADTSTYLDLPNDVPVQLVIGSKVTARLRKPQDGLFSGSIDAVDTSNNTYRITFDRPGLGTHSVPDYEVLSQSPPETLSLASYINKFRPRIAPPAYVPPPLAPAGSEQLTYGAIVAKATAPIESFVGAEYTTELLRWMVRMEKLLERKRDELSALVHLNRQAEQLQCNSGLYDDKFQARYAAAVIRLEEVNYVLHDRLRQCQLLLQDVTIAPGLLGCASLSPTPFRNRSITDAAFLIDSVTSSRKTRTQPIRSQRKKDLMQQLAALLLLVQQMSTNPDHSSCDVKVLQDSLNDIRRSLAPSNQKVFEDFVEVHMHHVMFQLNRQMAVKHPFMIRSK